MTSNSVKDKDSELELLKEELAEMKSDKDELLDRELLSNNEGSKNLTELEDEV